MEPLPARILFDLRIAPAPTAISYCPIAGIVLGTRRVWADSESRLSIKPVGAQLIAGPRHLASDVRFTGRISGNRNVENHSSGT